MTHSASGLKSFALRSKLLNIKILLAIIMCSAGNIYFFVNYDHIIYNNLDSIDACYTDLYHPDGVKQDKKEEKSIIDEHLNACNFLLNITILIFMNIFIFFILSFLPIELYILCASLYFLFIIEITIPIRILSLFEPFKRIYEAKPLFDYSDVCGSPELSHFGRIYQWVNYAFFHVLNNSYFLLYFLKRRYISYNKKEKAQQKSS